MIATRILGRGGVAAAIATFLVIATATTSLADGWGTIDTGGHGNKFDFNRYLGGEIAYDPGSSVGGVPTKRYERKPAILCHDDDVGDVEGCAWLIEKVANADCPKDSLPLDPLYVSTRDVIDGKPTDWSADWTLVEDAALCLSPAVLKEEVTKAFKSLTVEPSPIRVQPGSGQVLINMFTITYTDAASEAFHITLGEGDQMIPIEVQAVPTSFTWTYGDGSAPLTTTDPGKAYPDQTITHTFTRKGASSLGLSTTWSGRFRIEGLPADPDDPDTWSAIPGEARTTSPTLPITVYERRPHLVDDTLG